jgi:hypothetical protein
MPDVRGYTSVMVRADGRAAIERIAVTLAGRVGKRLTLNEALIEADRVINGAADGREARTDDRAQ